MLIIPNDVPWKCSQATVRGRRCRNLRAPGHHQMCAFHWHRRTTGHRSGWPKWFTPSCCIATFS